MKNRLSRGSALVIVMISTLVLIILGVGFITISKILGGGREMQNAVDSGALNAAKVALIRPGTKSAGNDEAQFLGFSSNDGKNPDYYLGNINRLWGQAMLVSLNAKAMEAEGSDDTTADTNANNVVGFVKGINDRVADSLKPVQNQPPQELRDAFLGSSNSNTLKMMSSQSSDAIQTSDGAQIGYQDANGPSNIAADFGASGILKDIIDPSDSTAKAALDSITTVLTQKQVASTSYMQGYSDIKLDASKQIYFVPLKPNAKPHMLAATEFNKTAPTLAAASNPINNSFFTKGKMREEKSANMMDFAAIALAEPVDDAFALSIPRGYVKVRNWKGFTIANTVLAVAASGPAIDGAQRGLNAAEYANHELLMARSSFKGPSVNGDIFTNEMGNPYYGLTDGNDKALKNGPQADKDPIFGAQGPIEQLMKDNKDGKTPPTDSMCNGAFSTPLPDGMKCGDIKDPLPNGMKMGMAEISVSVNGTGDVVSTSSTNNDLTTTITAYMVKNLDVDNNPWGSDIHPHLWSIDPQHVLQVWQTTSTNVTPNFMTTGPANDPYAWMYTGMQLLPDQGNSHYGRAGVTKQSPITFGKAGTLWQYLQDQDPNSGASHEQTQILNRLTQRILEIKPDFDKSKMEELLSTVKIDMGQDAYIYMDDQTNKMTMGLVKTNTTDAVDGSKDLPTWLVSEINAVGGKMDGNLAGLLGKTVLYGQSRRITTQPTDGQGNYVENVPGDWGYTTPYTNANNPPPGAQMVDVNLTSRYVFHPCTGYQGQLAVLDLQQFVNHDGCDANYAPGPQQTTPEKCPCVTFPTGSQPCPSGSCNVNTPNGWPDAPNGNGVGGGNPAPKGLPNCSHTGAC